MIDKSDRDNRTAKRRPALYVEKAIVLLLCAVGLSMMVVMNWQLGRLLWPWAIEVWWRWIIGFIAYSGLALGPALTLMGAISAATSQPSAKRLFWWRSTALLILIVIGLLTYWAFLPSGSWWQNGYWWSWAAIIVVFSIVASGARMFSVVQKVTERKRRDSFAHEWRFNRGDVNAPPCIGLAMSGGGIRSAAFNLGVLKALHEAGQLRSVDVMSAVSGGSYIMSWYLLQPFYASQVAEKNNEWFDIDDAIDEMFDSNARYQNYLCSKPSVIGVVDMTVGALLVGTTLEQPTRAIFSLDENLTQFNYGGAARRNYREGIQKLFHGHPSRDSVNDIDNAYKPTFRESQESHANFMRVTAVNYVELAQFAKEHGLPFFIFNCAALVERSSRHEIWPTAFELNADELGSDLFGYRRWQALFEHDEKSRREAKKELERVPRGLRWLIPNRHEDEQFGEWLQTVNLAPAISGAALGLALFDSKMSIWAARLKTWLPFIGNLDLGFLLPRSVWGTEVPVYVSDGGHSENLGAYALIMRRCRTIIIVDAEHEADVRYKFGGYVKLRDRLKKEKEKETMTLDVPAIEHYLKDESELMPPFVSTGTVAPDLEKNPKGADLSIIYVKLGLDKTRIQDYRLEVREHASETGNKFPQDTTLRQWYTPEKFVAYRELGRHSGCAVAQILKQRTEAGDCADDDGAASDDAVPGPRVFPD